MLEDCPSCLPAAVKKFSAQIVCPPRPYTQQVRSWLCFFFLISFVHSFFFSLRVHRRCKPLFLWTQPDPSQALPSVSGACQTHFSQFLWPDSPGAPVAHLGFGVGSKNTLSYTMAGCFKEAAIIAANHIFAILNGEILPWWCAVGLGILWRVLTGGVRSFRQKCGSAHMQIIFVLIFQNFSVTFNCFKAEII